MPQTDPPSGHGKRGPSGTRSTARDVALSFRRGRRTDYDNADNQKGEVNLRQQGSKLPTEVPTEICTLNFKIFIKSIG